MAGWQPFSACTVVRSDTFDSSAADVEPDVERLDEIIRGIEWAVATAPASFPELFPGAGIRIVLTGPPNLRTYYSYDPDAPDTCTLRWIEPIEMPEEED